MLLTALSNLIKVLDIQKQLYDVIFHCKKDENDYKSITRKLCHHSKQNRRNFYDFRNSRKITIDIFIYK